MAGRLAVLPWVLLVAGCAAADGPVTDVADPGSGTDSGDVAMPDPGGAGDPGADRDDDSPDDLAAPGPDADVPAADEATADGAADDGAGTPADSPHEAAAADESSADADDGAEILPTDPGGAADEGPDDGSGGTPDDAADDATDDTPDDMPDDLADDATVDAADDTPDDLADDATDDTPDDTPGDPADLTDVDAADDGPPVPECQSPSDCLGREWLVDCTGHWTCTKSGTCAAACDPIGCGDGTCDGAGGEDSGSCAIDCPRRDAHCDDGTVPICDRMPPVCTEFEILAYRQSCYVCVNPATCLPWGEAGCRKDAGCPATDWCNPCGTSSCPLCDDCLAACVAHGCPTDLQPLCFLIRPDCGDGKVAVVRDGCWVCVDRATCKP